MPTVTDGLATVPPMTDQHDLVATPPTQTTLLRIPRRRHFTLLHLLQTLMAACIWRRPLESRWIHPDCPRQESPTEHLARTAPYLYIRSLSGQ
jgi:hypothetical protein